MTELLQTALYHDHVSLGAKMVPFAGYSMPVSYQGIQAEHFAVRRQAGLFDASHMGVVRVEGEQALDLIQHLAVNDASRLDIGQCQYSALCYENGTCVDDIYVSRVAPDAFHVVVNASNKSKDLQWMQEHAQGLEVTLTMQPVGILALQGPRAVEVMAKVFGVEATQGRKNTCLEIHRDGMSFWISRTGYTGEDGFELFPAVENLSKVWQMLLEHGQEEGLVPCGLGCRDTLRLESGFSLYGHEINDQINLIEAGLNWIVALDAKDFVGKDALQSIRNQGASRRLIGLKAVERALPRDQMEVYCDERCIGQVTSGGISPVLGCGIALALVDAEAVLSQQILQVKIRDQFKPFEVVSRRFVKSA